jgi:predicted DNA-binding ribbon-helix-helix protein
MCQVFISADPALYESRARSVRLHGVATSIKLENLFWRVLDEIATRDGMGVPQLCTKLYDELVAERGAVDNFASFLRVCCGRYLALQLSGGIPQDASIPIASLNAQRVLATERQAVVHAGLQARAARGPRAYRIYGTASRAVTISVPSFSSATKRTLSPFLAFSSSAGSRT